MNHRMNKLFFSLTAALVADVVAAQVQPGTVSPNGGAVSSTQAQQRRSDVRQAVVAQRTVHEPGAAPERRLSPQEKAELRQQVRLHGQASSNGGN